MTESGLRKKVADTAIGYLGCRENNGTHKAIIDIYNGHKPLARGYRVTYTDAWCASFVSVVSILCELTDIMPTECGCDAMIALYQKLGRWKENDGYKPGIGDVIFYDWNDSGKGDCTGSSEHVGIVTDVTGTTITVIEGNKNDAVEYRKIAVNGRYIRGYGIPDFASKAAAGGTVSGASAAPVKSLETIALEVMDGKWGNGDDRKKRLQAAGYSYTAVQSKVNELLG